MTAGDAYAWLALNPRPVLVGDESPEEYDARLGDWLFQYSLVCEAIRDESHLVRMGCGPFND